MFRRLMCRQLAANGFGWSGWRWWHLGLCVQAERLSTRSCTSPLAQPLNCVHDVNCCYHSCSLGAWENGGTNEMAATLSEDCNAPVAVLQMKAGAACICNGHHQHSRMSSLKTLQ
jgi:hypothetical protein